MRRDGWGAARPKLLQLQGTGLDCVLKERGIRTHSPHPNICNRGIYFLSHLPLLIRLGDLGSGTKAHAHSSRGEAVPFPSTRWPVTGCNLSTTSVLFLLRPARGAGAKLHHSTWDRETGSSGVRRPTWSKWPVPTQPRLQKTLSPKGHGS